MCICELKIAGVIVILIYRSRNVRLISEYVNNINKTNILKTQYVFTCLQIKLIYLMKKNVSYTRVFRLVEEDASHVIRGVQDVLRVIDAQVTSFRGLVISRQSAPAILSFLVTLFYALYLRNLLQSCVAGSHTLFLCKHGRHTLSICVTQRYGHEQNNCRCYKIKTFQRETHANVWVDTKGAFVYPFW